MAKLTIRTSSFVRVKDRLPSGSCKVLVMAKNDSYQFAHPQLLTGHYVKMYYDTPINEFKLTGVTPGWEVVSWRRVELGVSNSE